MRIHDFKRTLWVCVILFSSAIASARAPSAPAALWQDRGDLTKLDMIHGSGGSENQPGMHFQFLKESKSGTAPKFEVRDENGIEWKVKLGEEARPESAATRLVWAAGYYTDDDYYRPEIHVEGLKELSRGNEYVRSDGTVVGARLERRRGDSDPASWSWFENPFIGTREFNGLRVVMALVNNWDLKDVNNAIYTQADTNIYAVADLGATFGRTGNTFKRSKGDVKEYAHAPFIDMATPEGVDLVISSRPFFMQMLFSPRYYVERTRMSKVAKAIPIDDARWVGNNLSRLSTGQIEDCFRSAGFSASEVETYTAVVKQRIAELTNL